MSQCVRCSKPCDVSSLLCDDCRSVLQSRVPTPIDEVEKEDGGESEHAALVLDDKSSDVVHNLNKAAKHLASVSESTLHQSVRTPRPPRLAPYQTVEMRQSDEPLPLSPYSTLLIPTASEVENLDLSEQAESRPSPSADEDKENNNIWDDLSDPLQSRHFPTPSEIRRIEEEDMRQAIEAGLVVPEPSLRTIPLTPFKKRTNLALSRRNVLLSLFLFAILALVADSVLVSLAFLRNPDPSRQLGNKTPSITVSKSDVHYNENIIVAIHNFSAFAHVALTRDIEEPLFGQTNLGLIQVKSNGSADIIVTILNSWRSGFHTIEAEDTTTRYTAATSLHIDVGPTQPAHLDMSATNINLGEGIQGANTIQSLTLGNKGSGTINWSATSDQSWLSLSPNHGIFSDHQKILVGATRANLAQGDYVATITISSNVDAPQTIGVQMKVNALPSNPGSVEAVSPALLTFNATDGGENLPPQAVAISNPGTEALYWSINSNTVNTTNNATMLPYTIGAFNSDENWLNTAISSGIVLPGKTSTVYVSVNSTNLLPGVYTRAILFETQQGHKALNNPLEVDVTLSIEPRCSLTLNPTDLTFTAVSGQNNPTTQSLNMTTSESCGDSTPWNASSSANWLSLLPTHGMIHESASSALTVSINTANLKPGLHTGNVMIAVPGQSSASVMVNLMLQPPPSPNAPIISAAPLSLTFSTTAGQSNPPGQTVTITNTGGSSLTWKTSINSSASSWLSASPLSGELLPGQTQQLSIKVNATGLTSGLYAGQIALNGLDNSNHQASGSPQNIAVNLSVLSPCTLTPPTSTQLAFNAIQGETSSSPQTIVLAASGNCSWPLKWKTIINNAPSWLNVTPTSGSFGNTGQSVILSVTANIAGVAAGSYQSTVTISVADATGQNLAGLTQSFSVTLSVAPPCTLQVSPTSFSFSLQEGYVSSAENIAISTTGSCTYPVNWQAVGDANSTAWLKLSAPSGIETGGGSAISVTADASQLALGTYNGTITLTASDISGTTLQASPITIPVTLTVTGFTLSGTITACTDVTCSTPFALAGATITITDNTANTVLTNATADTSGNYSISNLPSGSYTISVTGTDALGTSYSGISTVTLSSDKSVNVTTSSISVATQAAVTPSP
jgi:Viral BACON domain/Prealbumin-like fold domain